MAVIGYELYVVNSEYVTADLLVWKRYRQKAIGIVELMLDRNPQLGRMVHRYTPFIPVGTYVRIPIDPDLLQGRPTSDDQINVWTSNLLA